MAPVLVNKTIRLKSGSELAAYLRDVHRSTSSETITNHLIDGVASGSLDPDAFVIWLGVCHSPDAVVAAMRQDVSVAVRRAGIKRFGGWLRKDTGFRAIWEAVEGVDGLVYLMAKTSVADVDYLCAIIRKSSRARGAVEERQKSMSALFKALHREGSDVSRNPDRRPLQSSYIKITQACAVDVALRGSDLPNDRAGHLQYLAHARAYEAKAIQGMFTEAENGSRTLDRYRHLIGWNRMFALEILEHLSENNAALVANAQQFVKELAIPLVKRMGRKKEDKDTFEHTLRLIVHCVRQLTEDMTYLRFLSNNEGKVGSGKDVIFYFALAWKRFSLTESRAPMEQWLGTLVHIPPATYLDSLSQVTRLLEVVEYSQRPRLLHLLLMNAQAFRVNIYSETKEQDEKIRSIDGWLANIFTALPSDTSLPLFLRLKRLRPDDKLFQDDNDRLLIQLGGVSEEDLVKRATDKLVKMKAKASTARDPRERAEAVQSALLAASDAKSLEVFKDTLLWARRFNRDWQTVKSLYKGTILSSTIDLLSGIQLTGSKQLTKPLQDVKAIIIEANAAILLMFETAAMVLREPWFLPGDWVAVLETPKLVVNSRMKKVLAMKESQLSDGVNDNDIFKNIWGPTLDLLIAVEEFRLADENQGFGDQHLAGPLADVPLAATASCEFLDVLAQKRDELWRQHRIKTRPATLSLGPQWSRGLPLQFLCPKTYLMSMTNVQLLYPEPDWKSMPYVRSRAEAIVFTDGPSSLAALPEDQELHDAIGPFQDSYRFALHIYIMKGGPDAERNLRFMQAWKHATTELGGDRMSVAETLLFWRDVFKDVVNRDNKMVFPDELAPLPGSPYPISSFPECDDLDEMPVEWNPDPTYKASQLPSRQLQPTCIDCMLAIRYGMYASPKTEFSVPSPHTFETSRQYLFDYHSTSQHVPLAVASAAYVNTKLGSDSSFLLKPFPSQTDVRIPALYLDQDFLTLADKKGARPGTVAGFAAGIPVQLLVQLAQSLMARHEQDPKADHEVLRVMMQVIRSLSRSDRPEFACELIQDIILNHQNESSWHRHLLNIGFLRQLKPGDVRDFFRGLSSKIQERLARHQDLRETPATDEPRRPYVKVTTLKLLTQMLQSVNFVETGLAVEILAELLTTAKHPDVRLAVIDSLLSMLGSSSTFDGSSMDAVIFDVVTRHVIDLAASLDERSPTTEDQWLVAETSDAPLPGVYDDDLSYQLPPILSLLVNTKERWKKGSAGRRKWIIRILGPVVKQSMANRRRWMALFMKRYGLTVDNVDRLPSMPVNTQLLLRLFFEEPEFFTRANFEIIKCYVMLELQLSDVMLPSPEMVVKSHPELKDSNAIKYWDLVWGGFQGPPTVIHYITRYLKEPLLSSDTFTDPDGTISNHDIKTFVLVVVEGLLTVRQDVSMFASVVDGLTVPTLGHDHLWLANCLPLMRQIIDRVEGLRTEAWQRDPGRIPAQLPQTFRFRSTVLRSVYTSAGKARRRSIPGPVIANFVAESTILLEELAGDAMLYHEHWQSLKSDVLHTFGPNCAVRIVLELAAPIATREPKPLGLIVAMRVELLEAMLVEASDPEDVASVKQLRALLGDWARCPVEGLRNKARTIAELLGDRALNKETHVKNRWFGTDGLDE